MFYRYIRTLFLIVLISASDSLLAVELEISPNDPADYEYFTLPNNMKVLVVSDPDADKAAAALNVRIGSMHDPEGRQGMAHFLEHMLFLGTKKYPDPDAYRNFMVSHGGNDNAYTANENTVYFFELDKDYLHEALDRFSGFFVSPLFNRELVERERKAVESEFRLKIREDSRRIYQVIKETLNPQHPIAQFSVGNLETLADRNGISIRDELIAFYNHYYSANLMTLSVLGKEDTATLRKWVEKFFSEVPDRKTAALRPSVPLLLDKQKNIRINAVPIKDTRSLTMSFAYPWKESYYMDRPALLVSHLIGHEGKGSLFALLKEKGWVNSLSAGSGLRAGNYATFDINIDFTEEGINHIDETVALTFKYINLIRKKGISTWAHEELARMSRINFANREKSSPVSEVLAFSGNLQNYPPELATSAGYYIGKFDRKIVNQVLDRIRPENMRMLVVDRNRSGDRKSRWYETEYSITDISEKLPTLLKADTDGEELLALPSPNPFIPDDMAIKKAESVSEVPKKVYKSTGIEVWHKKDNWFNDPKADLFIELASEGLFKSEQNRVLAALYLGLVRDSLNEYSYPARLAGLAYGLHGSKRGISISIHGYNDKQKQLLDRIIDVILNLEIRDDRFAVIKENLIQDWKNRKLERPYRQTIREAAYLINLDQIHPDKLQEIAENIRPAALKNAYHELLGKIRITVLGHGNILEDELIDIARDTGKRLSTKSVLSNSRPERVSSWIGKSTRIYSMDIDHDDSSIVVYYQGKSASLQEQAGFMLLQQLLRAPFFGKLRTEQQLGYIVHAGRGSMYRVPLMRMIIQSSVAAPDILLERIDHFLEQQLAELNAMSKDEFETHRQGLLNEYLKKDNSLSERSRRFNRELQLGYTDFRLRENIEREINRLSRKKIVALYKRLFLSGQHGRLIVQNTGKAHTLKKAPGKSLIQDAESYRASLKKYVH